MQINLSGAGQAGPSFDFAPMGLRSARTEAQAKAGRGLGFPLPWRERARERGLAGGPQGPPHNLHHTSREGIKKAPLLGEVARRAGVGSADSGILQPRFRLARVPSYHIETA